MRADFLTQNVNRPDLAFVFEVPERPAVAGRQALKGGTVVLARTPLQWQAAQDEVAKEAGVGRLVLSHFYPIADRYDVKAQAGEEYDGKIWKGKDLLTIKL